MSSEADKIIGDIAAALEELDACVIETRRRVASEANPSKLDPEVEKILLDTLAAIDQVRRVVQGIIGTGEPHSRREYVAAMENIRNVTARVIALRKEIEGGLRPVT